MKKNFRWYFFCSYLACVPMCSCMYDCIFLFSLFENWYQNEFIYPWAETIENRLVKRFKHAVIRLLFFFHVMYLVSVDYVFLRTPYRFQRFPVQMKKGQLKYKDESSVTQHTAQRCKNKSHDISPSTKLDAIYYLLTCYECARLQAIEVALEKEKTHSDETSRKKSILSVISSLFFPVSVNMQDGLLLLLFFLS